MPKVTFMIGVTLKPRDYESIRGDLAIEVDTDGDVPAQIKAAVEAQALIAEAAEPALGTQLANLSGITIDGIGVTPQFLAFKAYMKALTTNIIGEVTKHKLTLEKAAEDKVLVLVIPPTEEEKAAAEAAKTKTEEKLKEKKGRRGKKQSG